MSKVPSQGPGRAGILTRHMASNSEHLTPDPCQVSQIKENIGNFEDREALSESSSESKELCLEKEHRGQGPG